jgi:hypothetical protein
MRDGLHNLIGGSDMEERRKRNRSHLAFFTRLFNRQTGEMLGYLANITNEGAMLICETPVPVGKVYRLFMDLTEIDFGKPHLDFDGECLWCRLDEINPDSFNAGFSLSGLDEQDNVIIERIVREYSLRR